MQRIFDCSVDTELLTGMRLAKVALGRTELVVLPTDTVYGIAANAFSPKRFKRCSMPKAAVGSRHRQCW